MTQHHKNDGTPQDCNGNYIECKKYDKNTFIINGGGNYPVNNPHDVMRRDKQILEFLDTSQKKHYTSVEEYLAEFPVNNNK